MNNSVPTVPAKPAVSNDVLQSDHHGRFTTQEIAKAVERHKREHPNEGIALGPQKTTPKH